MSQGASAPQGHLSCPAPSTPAAPHPSSPASSTALAAPCCLVWCPPDMGGSRSHTGAQRRAGMVIPLGHLGEDPLEGPLPLAVSLVIIDAPLPGAAIKDVTWNSCLDSMAWRWSLQPAPRAYGCPELKNHTYRSQAFRWTGTTCASTSALAKKTAAPEPPRAHTPCASSTTAEHLPSCLFLFSLINHFAFPGGAEIKSQA